MARVFASRIISKYVYNLMKTLFRALLLLTVGTVPATVSLQAQAPFKVPEIPVERYKPVSYTHLTLPTILLV